VYGLQGTKLLNNKEQKEDHGTAGNEEILSKMPSSHGSSRDEVAFFLIEFLDGL
jgi:hypothetical protein